MTGILAAQFRMWPGLVPWTQPASYGAVRKVRRLGFALVDNEFVSLGILADCHETHGVIQGVADSYAAGAQLGDRLARVRNGEHDSVSALPRPVRPGGVPELERRAVGEFELGCVLTDRRQRQFQHIAVERDRTREIFDHIRVNVDASYVHSRPNLRHTSTIISRKYDRVMLSARTMTSERQRPRCCCCISGLLAGTMRGTCSR